MARNVLSRSKDNPFRPKVRDREASPLESTYRIRIDGQEEKRTKRGIQQKKITGLLEHGYLQVHHTSKNEKGNHSKKYFLTLKGCFFVLGNDMNDDELIAFIENASKNYLFFKYILRTIEFTSMELGRKIFLEPIKGLIKKDRINLDDDFELSFALIAEKIGQSVNKNYGMFAREYSDMMKNNWYDGSSNRDWLKNMVMLYYQNDNEREIFRKYLVVENDPNLLSKVMQAVHFGFYSHFDEPIPIKHVQKLPKLKSKILPFPKNKTWVTATQLWEYRKRRRIIPKSFL